MVLNAFPNEMITQDLQQFLEASVSEYEQTGQRCEMSSAHTGLRTSNLLENGVGEA